MCFTRTCSCLEDMAGSDAVLRDDARRERPDVVHGGRGTAARCGVASKMRWAATDSDVGGVAPETGWDCGEVGWVGSATVERESSQTHGAY